MFDQWTLNILFFAKGFLNHNGCILTDYWISCTIIVTLKEVLRALNICTYDLKHVEIKCFENIEVPSIFAFFFEHVE